MLTVEQLSSVYAHLKNQGASIALNGDEVEISFDCQDKKQTSEHFLQSVPIATDSFSKTSVSIKSELDGLLLFDHLDSMLDQLNLDISLLNQYNIFVFDVEGHYFHYNYQTREVISNSVQPRIKFLIPHFIQYKGLLDIYLAAEGSLYEIWINILGGSEFVVLSKGEKKLVTTINYKTIDKSIFIDDNVTIPIDEFGTKILSEEWLACYNETLCQFMDAQLPQRRTFSILFNNFNYLLNLTGQNFQLYILKFSFEKIRKQFKTEKNNYFDNLNTAQDKISGQIISVPISLGASIFSFYQFNTSPLIISLIFLAICMYTLFIGFVVIMNLYDIRKIATDANDEEDNLKTHYPDLLKELEKDFTYMKNKRIRVRVLAWAILLALIVTLISLAVFVMNYQEVKTSTFHLL